MQTKGVSLVLFQRNFSNKQLGWMTQSTRLFCESHGPSKFRSLLSHQQRSRLPKHRALSDPSLVRCSQETSYWEGSFQGKDNYFDATECSKVLPLNSRNCGLYLTRGEWAMTARKKKSITLTGILKFQNTTHANEIFVTDVSCNITVLSKGSVRNIDTYSFVEPMHEDDGLEYEPRADGYWPGYVTTAGSSTGMRLTIEFTSTSSSDLALATAAWLVVEYGTYGPHGRVAKTQHVILPLQAPEPLDPKNLQWSTPTKSKKEGDAPHAQAPPRRLALPTHLLTTLDDPVEIVKRYALPYSEPGDIVTLGETPLAAMQGRWRHPETVRPGLLARLGCRAFQPTSSLATSCGLQALIDLRGRRRVAAALVIGTLARLVLRKRGVFYQVAGYEANLLDDLTGCIPPYDKFIMPGPKDPQAVVDRIKSETGLDCAIVDVNDKSHYLGLSILAISNDAMSSVVEKAVLDNPSGNGVEQTPLVLIRP